MKNRRRIYFVRQGIQGGFAVCVIVAILLGGLALSFSLVRELKLQLTVCMTFAHVKCDRPVELVQSIVLKYSLFGLAFVALLALVSGYYIMSRVKKGARVLASDIEEYVERGKVSRVKASIPYEIDLLRGKFFYFVEEYARKMEKVGLLLSDVRTLAEQRMLDEEARIEVAKDILEKLEEVKGDVRESR